MSRKHAQARFTKVQDEWMVEIQKGQGTVRSGDEVTVHLANGSRKRVSVLRTIGGYETDCGYSQVAWSFINGWVSDGSLKSSELETALNNAAKEFAK